MPRETDVRDAWGTMTELGEAGLEPRSSQSDHPCTISADDAVRIRGGAHNGPG